MENCLVTKLKKVVNNPNLDYLGYVRINFKAAETSTGRFIIATYSQAGKAFVEGGTFSDGTTEKDLGAGAQTTLYIGLSACSVYVPKYNMVRFYLSDGIYYEDATIKDIDFMNYNSGIQTIMLNGIENADLNALSHASNLSACFLHGELCGDIVALKDLTSLQNLALFNNTPITRDKVYGDVSNFGKLTNLTHVFNFYTNITGTVESLAEAQVSNGRTSGTLLLDGSWLVTVGGRTFANSATITFDSSLPNGYSITDN